MKLLPREERMLKPHSVVKRKPPSGSKPKWEWDKGREVGGTKAGSKGERTKTTTTTKWRRKPTAVREGR